MKNVFVLVLISLSSASAFALPMTAKITRMELDRDFSGRYAGGTITVNPEAREATLRLIPAKCPPGRMCPAVMRAPVEITLELVSRKYDRCQSIVYVAKSDLRLVDGLRQRLVITDYSSSRCMTIPELGAVEATYETDGRSMNGPSIHTFSRFSAKAFVSPMY